MTVEVVEHNTIVIPFFILILFIFIFVFIFKFVLFIPLLLIYKPFMLSAFLFLAMFFFPLHTLILFMIMTLIGGFFYIFSFAQDNTQNNMGS